MPYRIIALFILLTAGITACDRKQQYSSQLFLFGTIVEVTIRSVDQRSADTAVAELQQRFTGLHKDLHAWEEGQLTGINHAFANGQSVPSSADILNLVQRSQHLEQHTGGTLNPAKGALVALWGFHTSVYPVIGPPPTQQQIRTNLQGSPSTLDIEIAGDALFSRNPAVQLDFGGVAKGLAVDIAIEILQQHGIDDAIVNAGGDLRAIGDAGNRPWRVAVRRPGGGIIGSLDTIANEAVFTSGSSERYREHETERYPHILDPRTGYPASGLSSVTVIADEGLLADAAATALFVAGPEDWPEIASALGLDQVLVIEESGDMQITPAMQDRFVFSDSAVQLPQVVTLP
jgi:thiamine biosynthesis lipoprotein